MPDSRKTNPEPVVRPLQSVPVTGAAVNPGYLTSFVPAQAPRIPYNTQGGRGLLQLAAALSRVEPALTGALEHSIERRVEQGVAEGMNLFNSAEATEGDAGDDRLRLTFREMTEKHPELTAQNPYAWKGWEKARLNVLALDYDKGLQDMYTQSGLKNSADPEEVRKAVDAYNTAFREERGLNEYPNPLDMAREFTAHTVRSRESIGRRHSADLSANLEKKLIQSATEKSLKQIELSVGAGYSPDGVRVDDPTTEDAALDRIHAIITGNLNDALNNGLRAALQVETYADTVFTLYERNDEDPTYLKLLDREVGGVRPSSLPGVQAKVNQLEEQRISRAHAAWVRGRAYAKARREDEELAWQRAGASLMLMRPRSAPPLTLDTPLDDKGNTLRTLPGDPLAKVAFLETANNVQRQENALVDNNPTFSMLREVAKAKQRRAPNLGEAIRDDMFYGARKEIVQEALTAIEKREDKLFKAREELASWGMRFITGKSEEDILGGALDFDGGLKEAAVLGVETQSYLRQRFDEEAAKKLKEAKTRGSETLNDNEISDIQNSLRLELIRGRSRADSGGGAVLSPATAPSPAASAPPVNTQEQARQQQAQQTRQPAPASAPGNVPDHLAVAAAWKLKVAPGTTEEEFIRMLQAHGGQKSVESYYKAREALRGGSGGDTSSKSGAVRTPVFKY